MKKLVLSPFLLLILGLLPLSILQAQFDDLYYDPNTDESFIFNSSNYDDGYDYDNVAYEDEYDERNENFDDYSYDYQ